MNQEMSPKRNTTLWILLGCGAVIVIAVLCVCGVLIIGSAITALQTPASQAAPATQVPTEAPAAPAPTDTLQPTPLPPAPVSEATFIPTPAPPTPTPVSPTATPVPTYSEPVTLAEIEGTGKVVTDNYEFSKCQKAVFYWTAFPSGHGSASLIVKLYNMETGKEMSIVNEFEMDVSNEGLSGSTLQALIGGEYYFATENTDEAWKLRVECQDGVAPIAVGNLNVEGTGNAVTDNYELPTCNKSVFVWKVNPTKSGTASIIAYLVKVGTDQAVSLANEFVMDQTEPLEGETVQKLSGGLYYLYVYNTGNRAWNIRWECRD